LIVWLVSFGGPVTLESLARLDSKLLHFIAQNGVMSTIIDFTSATTIEVQPSTLVNRGNNRSLMSGRPRVFITDNPLMFGLLRMYSTHQDNFGELAPSIVWSLPEAFETLGLTRPIFEPVEFESTLRSTEPDPM
jgi:hypothetical protein